jgi:integrase
MKGNKIKITKERVDKIPFAASGQTIYRDTDLPGFGLRVGADTKAYIAQKKVAGKKIVVTIGIHGQITADFARDLATKKLGEITGWKHGIGNNPSPVQAKKEAKARAVTLKQAFDDYLAARTNLKPSTRKEYAQVIAYISDWHDTLLSAISKDMIQNRHRLLTVKRGKARANYAMRVLRAVYNFALDYYEVQGKAVLYENPVKRLSQARAWHKIKGRTDYIKADELPLFFSGIEKIENPTIRDYFLLVLFTGLRRQEAARLKWENVNWTAKTITITDTKNSDPLELPLSDYLYDLLQRRKENGGTTEWVFPGTGKNGFLVEPKLQLKRLKDASGLNFSIHGLRRTFVTIAEGIDLSAYAIKRLVNHRQSEQDITGRYIMKDVERLREPVQKIADYILAKGGKNGTGRVIPIRKGKKA